MCSANQYTLGKKISPQDTDTNENAQSNATGYDVCDVFRSQKDERSLLTNFLFIFWIIALIKEIVEMGLSFRLSACFYFKQVENWGQIIVHFIAMPIGLLSSSENAANWIKDQEGLVYFVCILYWVIRLNKNHFACVSNLIFLNLRKVCLMEII